MTDIEDLARGCRDQLDAMLPLLEELVNQNSYSRTTENVAKAGEILARELRAIDGLDVELVESATHAPHLVARSEAARSSGAGAVGLVGHHDTVFPPGTFEGFSRDGDIARGPGVLDMKGGLTVAVFALRQLSEAGLLAKVPVRFVCVSDEEIGSPEGHDVLVRELEGASCALVFEAGRANDMIITQRKGTGGIKVVAHGVAAHAGNHHDVGKNAIWSLARFVDAAQRLTDYDRGVTVNVGTITGGTSRNTVPEHAEALVDIRFIRTEDGEQVVEALKKVAAEATLEGTRLEVHGGIARPPLNRTDGNVALYREYAVCAEAAGLGGTECPLIGGGSDASTAAAIGVPAIDGLGPRGKGFHTKDEMIELSSLPMRLEALVRFLAARAA